MSQVRTGALGRKIMQEEIKKKLQEKLGIKNPMALPKISKIVLNMGVKEALSDKKNLDIAITTLSLITGQKPKVTKAKKSIATFKLRAGDSIGVVVTLRGKKMDDFFRKLVAIILPRVRDFHGVSAKGFDRGGNYTLGFQEALVFPEIDPAKIERVMGLELTIVTSAKNEGQGRALLEELGMPFQKEVR